MKIRYIAIPFWLMAAAALASSTNDLPKFDEIYQLLRTHLNGVNDTELDRAAVQGLLTQFQSTAMLVGDAASETAKPVAPLDKASVFDDSYAYFRVRKVETNLASELADAYRDLVKTNKAKIKGVVLDLRFAGGSDFPAAAAAADCFLNSDQPLLMAGGTTLQATKKDDAISGPLAVLINSKTSEAAEGLAAILRMAGAGLLIGTETAGHASMFRDFPLTDGDKLRIASGEVKLGDGSVLSGGIKPDISVEITLADDRAYQEHPYQIPGSTNTVAGTNAEPAFRRMSEAELVREQRDGEDLEADFNAANNPPTDADIKELRDPSLARALDLLKGLAVIQKGHSG